MLATGVDSDRIALPIFSAIQSKIVDNRGAYLQVSRPRLWLDFAIRDLYHNKLGIRVNCAAFMITVAIADRAAIMVGFRDPRSLPQTRYHGKLCRVHDHRCYRGSRRHYGWILRITDEIAEIITYSMGLILKSLIWDSYQL